MDVPSSPAEVRFFDRLAAAADPATELRAGLVADPACIAPKYFYDALGARLFEAICELPEYTLPRDEHSIFLRRIDEIAAAVGTGSTVLDLGAGNCAKAERLFAALRPSQYVAVDINGDYLRGQLASVAQRHPEIEVIGVAADFMRGLDLPDEVRSDRRLAFYPGSSIGNFSTNEATRFLARLRELCAGGHLLLGADLLKDRDELLRAYDDALGVTAAFNLNVLNVVNRFAGTDFDLGDWRHVALFNAAASRIEMHLEARAVVTVTWPGGRRRFAAGERIHTENSYKYTLPGLSALLGSAGYSAAQTYTDPANRFALVLAQ
ncbi:MAG TPA: L-histidine N(alpha)-methyltransferase [Burkholderiaceae bacterium]|nr:L-histidine N(alpha)-methyltransferase [Burkholderiaceae bacterium]HQR69711.1 L-histidine N(alpha)-methyltransferase [Burkholderiaceae bacterium]